MHRENDRIALGDMAAEPLDLIGIHVRRRHFDCRRKIQNRLVLRRGLPHLVHGITDLDGEIELGAGEALGAVLEHPLCLGLLQCLLAHAACTLDGDVDDAGLVETEHDTALHGRGRVVQMHDRALSAAQRLERAFDQLGTRLREHLNDYIVGDQIALDQLAHEVEVCLRRRRKSDLDLLEARLDQQIEHPPLACRIHRLDECLIAIAQIHAAPQWRCGERAIGPSAIFDRNGGKRTVLGRRVLQHG